MSKQNYEAITASQPTTNTISEQPSNWTSSNNNAVGIILAICVLIGAIAQLIKVLIPVMMVRSKDK